MIRINLATEQRQAELKHLDKATKERRSQVKGNLFDVLRHRRHIRMAKKARQQAVELGWYLP